MGNREQEPQGRCTQGRSRQAELGRQSEVAGGNPIGALDDECEARLDTEAR